MMDLPVELVVNILTSTESYSDFVNTCNSSKRMRNICKTHTYFITKTLLKKWYNIKSLHPEYLFNFIHRNRLTDTRKYNFLIQLINFYEIDTLRNQGLQKILLDKSIYMLNDKVTKKEYIYFLVDDIERVPWRSLRLKAREHTLKHNTDVIYEVRNIQSKNHFGNLTVELELDLVDFV